MAGSSLRRTRDSFGATEIPALAGMTRSPAGRACRDLSESDLDTLDHRTSRASPPSSRRTPGSLRPRSGETCRALIRGL
ncbi:protein of unknown function [Micropruina glycogenica]|uniref:Uncharacterized protein n=1 Tax=Micropruina glycogenica TaxID=75385 RepID=A0A2N9JKX5_9ACTN|nr:protein of unknown function [Micropruina glycogenica]